MTDHVRNPQSSTAIEARENLLHILQCLAGHTTYKPQNASLDSPVSDEKNDEYKRSKEMMV
jgi:hypothetical protein